MEPKVIILMSTYNGEKYVEEQMESLLGQSYKNIEIYIRDDGSRDKTVDILKLYETNPKIHLIQGNNVGFIDSFFEVVRVCGDADYYAFCDQDDKWMPEKIQYGVEMLDMEDQKSPLLYFSNYDFYNEKMEFMNHKKPVAGEPSFQNSLVDCMPLGFTVMFNKRAMELLKSHIPENSCGHDWWTYMVCAGLGKIIYDDRVTVCYRRTGNNVSPGGMDFLKFQLWRIKKFFKNDYFTNIRKMLKEYHQCYYDTLDDEKRALLDLFVVNPSKIGNRIKKVTYTKRLRQTIFDELAIRIIFLMGKL